VFGFPGILNGETIIHSDMLGISPAYRSHGLGYLLKRAQREAAMKLGVNRITWTFDPLQSRNAHLNFSKLGVIADRYYVDYYGVTSSFLHRFGTDRLWVTWLLNSERVKARMEQTRADEVIRAEDIVIEIPCEITSNHEHWRVTTREAFTSAIEAGYIVEEFVVSGNIGRYVLRKTISRR
jgi:predicted GNAT superfamily acetyltransferase